MTLDPRGAVLHVEDDPQVRRALAMLLSDEYELNGVASGAEALALVTQGFRPDVLIVDFNLGDQPNGAEAAEELRSALGYALPIILLTGDPYNAEAPWITDAPVWLTHKPMDGLVLLAAVPFLVQLSRALRTVNASRPAAHG
ncbi:MAG: response regulator [Steroidobacteraceae bacterium]